MKHTYSKTGKEHKVLTIKLKKEKQYKIPTVHLKLLKVKLKKKHKKPWITDTGIESTDKNIN